MNEPLRLTREMIPVGRDNAVTRADLSQMTGLCDRLVRREITRLRVLDCDDPYVICSSSRNPPGYWRSDDPAEIDMFSRETRARASNTLKLLKDITRWRAMNDVDQA